MENLPIMEPTLPVEALSSKSFPVQVCHLSFPSQYKVVVAQTSEEAMDIAAQNERRSVMILNDLGNCTS
jgi:hypothetical protein